MVQLIQIEEPLPDIEGKSLYQDLEKPWRWMLTKPVFVKLSNGFKLIIPAGYVTDFASVPRALHGIVQPLGRYNLAVLVHDWLYDAKFDGVVGDDWKKDRKFADDEMNYWMIKSKVKPFKRGLIYWPVRLFGRRKWLD